MLLLSSLIPHLVATVEGEMSLTNKTIQVYAHFWVRSMLETLMHFLYSCLQDISISLKTDHKINQDGDYIRTSRCQQIQKQSLQNIIEASKYLSKLAYIEFKTRTVPDSEKYLMTEYSDGSIDIYFPGHMRSKRHFLSCNSR